jgi:hypothetical protein
MKLLITSLLCKIQPTAGVDPVPTGAANAVLLRGQPTLDPLTLTQDARNLILPYFGNQGSMPSAAFGKLQFQFELAGAGTAGIAAAYGPILRACAKAETLLAAPLTGTGQVGGGTTGIKLAAGASAVNDFYDGMPISITGGTGSGQSGVIVDYDGTTKIALVASLAWVTTDATSAYSIGACATYRPITQSLEMVALYFNIDGVLHKFLGGRGSVSYDFHADKIPFASVSIQGVYVPVADGAAPTVVVTNWIRPLVANAVNTPLFMLHGFAAAALDALTMDMGNVLSNVARINVPQRVDIVNRKAVGTVSMEAVLTATKAWFADCVAATLGSMALVHGTVTGNIVALSSGNIVLNSPKYADSNGIAMIQMGYDVIPLNGNDEMALAVY